MLGGGALPAAVAVAAREAVVVADDPTHPLKKGLLVDAAEVGLDDSGGQSLRIPASPQTSSPWDQDWSTVIRTIPHEP